METRDKKLTDTLKYNVEILTDLGMASYYCLFIIFDTFD